MQSTLLKLLYRKTPLSYIVFDSNFAIVETNKNDVIPRSDIRDFLWEIVGLEEQILLLPLERESIGIPMIQRDGVYYDIEITAFEDEKKQRLFVATLQKKTSYAQEYADAIKKINKKTLDYELSDEKKQDSSYREINKHLMTLHIDLGGYITMVNQASLLFFNLSKEEMIGKHFSSFFQPQKSQLSVTNIFLARNAAGEDLFFYADIIPLVDKSAKVRENVIVAQDITHLKKIKYELEYAQEHDTLTGIPNRHRFLKVLDERIEEDEVFYTSFVDIDGFRQINEEYGAHAADMLLKHLSALLLEFIEREDILTRLHADTFAIVFETGKTKGYIEALLKKLPELFRQNPLRYSDEDTIEFSATTILLGYPQDIKSSKEIINLAQKLMQRKKIERKGSPL